MEAADKPPTQSGRPPKLKVISLGQLLRTDFPEREHLVFPWLRQGESAMIYAKPGVGKSMLVLSLALAVAGGGEMMGWQCRKPRKVVFWDGEMYADDLRARAAMLAKCIPGLDLRSAETNLFFIARQHQDYRVKFPDIADEEGQSAVFASAMEYEADLVVIDNLSTLALAIEDENAAAEFNKVMGLLMRFKQANKACILVHHSNKSGTDYRGSSKMATTFEVMLQLEAVNTIKSLKGTTFTLKWTKFRGERDQSMVNKDVWLGEDKQGVKGWQHEVSKTDQATQLVELVRSLEYPSGKALAEALGVSKGQVSKLKKRAIALSLIKLKEWDDCLEAAREAAQEEDPYGQGTGTGLLVQPQVQPLTEF